MGLKFKYRAYIKVINDEFYDQIFGRIVEHKEQNTFHYYLIQLDDGREVWIKEEDLTEGPYFVSPPS